LFYLYSIFFIKNKITLFFFNFCYADIVDANGTSVVLQSTFGQLTTNAKGQCSNEAGVLLPELLAYGLGAGQFTNPEVGGEESFAGRVDGVWLYSKSSVLLEEINWY